MTDTRSVSRSHDFTLRLAEPADLPALRALMDAAIGRLQAPFLSPDEVAASFSIMGLDTQLVADRTYFVVEAGARRCSAATTRPAVTRPCSTRPRTRRGCAPCTPIPTSCAWASGG